MGAGSGAGRCDIRGCYVRPPGVSCRTRVRTRTGPSATSRSGKAQKGSPLIAPSRSASSGGLPGVPAGALARHTTAAAVGTCRGAHAGVGATSAVGAEPGLCACDDFSDALGDAFGGAWYCDRGLPIGRV